MPYHMFTEIWRAPLFRMRSSSSSSKFKICDCSCRHEIGFGLPLSVISTSADGDGTMICRTIDWHSSFRAQCNQGLPGQLGCSASLTICLGAIPPDDFSQSSVMPQLRRNDLTRTSSLLSPLQLNAQSSAADLS